ncbi:MAG: hypothetical protein QW801_06880, partial [Candidatus Caldarchaeum sp.]
MKSSEIRLVLVAAVVFIIVLGLVLEIADAAYNPESKLRRTRTKTTSTPRTITTTSSSSTTTSTTSTSTGYSDTFPAVNPAILGTCPPEVHDRYYVIGPDGRKYRTWHPVTVPIDPANPSRGTCTFAHEHGDNPRQGSFNDLPAFGYAAKVAGMVEEIAAHAGFKVFY